MPASIISFSMKNSVSVRFCERGAIFVPKKQLRIFRGRAGTVGSESIIGIRCYICSGKTKQPAVFVVHGAEAVVRLFFTLSFLRDRLTCISRPRQYHTALNRRQKRLQEIQAIDIRRRSCPISSAVHFAL